MSFLKVKLQGGEISLDSFTCDKVNGRLAISGLMGNSSVELEILLPFKINKLKDELFDASRDIDRIIILRNVNFAERNLIKLRFHTDDRHKSIGYIFSLGTILDDEGIHNEHFEKHPALRSYMVRSIVSLLTNQASYLGNIPDYRLDASYSIYDFFPADILICAISKDQLPDYNDDIETSLLYWLNLYGFYYIDSQASKDFLPAQNELQKMAFEAAINENGEGLVSIYLINKDLVQEPFVENYIRSLINKQQDDLNKFLLSYQIFELMIDKVTKLELKKRIIEDENIMSKKGFKIKSIVQEISTESYRIEKLFKHYCKFTYSSDRHMCSDIKFLFDKYHENFISKEDYSSYFYEFRNQIVHNLRLLFSGSKDEMKHKSEILSNILSKMEFFTVEAITSFTEK